MIIVGNDKNILFKLSWLIYIVMQLNHLQSVVLLLYLFYNSTTVLNELLLKYAYQIVIVIEHL